MPWQRFWFRKAKEERQIDAELRFHLDEMIDANLSAGMSHEEAKRNAYLTFGGTEQLKEECRELYRLNRLENFSQDLKHSLRGLRKSPFFALVAIAILGLGIGANTTVFSIVNTLLLQPLPFPGSHRIVEMRRRIDQGSSFSFDMHDFVAIRKNQQSFSALAVMDWGPGRYNLVSGGEPESIHGLRVSALFFSVFGVSPLMGRTFQEGDDDPGHARVAVISQALWTQRFGGDPSIVGQILDIGGDSYTVSGVVPSTLRAYTPADVFLCMPVPRESTDRTNNHVVLARLKPGLTQAQAEAEVDTIARRHARQSSLTNMPQGIVLRQLQQETVGMPIRSALQILFGAVGLVLLVACSNVANLILARGAGRRREIAVMTALGAARGRIVSRLLTESLVLGALGGALGLYLAYWGVRALPLLSVDKLPQADRIGIDIWALAFTFLAAMVSGLLAGLAPAFRLSRSNLTDALKQGTVQGGSGYGAARLRSGLVVLQVALSTVLLAGSLLLVRSFWNLTHLDLGFRQDHVLTMKIGVSGARYPNSRSAADYYKRIAEAVEHIPGVVAASSTTMLPSECCMDFPVTPVGAKPHHSSRNNTDSDDLEPLYRAIDPHYFKALGIPLQRGRVFQDTDTAGSEPVVVVNQFFAQKAFPHEDALGRAVIIGNGYLKDPRDLRPRRIVGIVGDTREAGLMERPPMVIFVPAPQSSDVVTRIGLEQIPTRWVIRTTGDPLQVAPAVRRAVLQVDQTQPPADFESLEEVLSESVASSRFIMLMLIIFAGLALVLAAIGIYGLMAYSVAQRTREIGTRISLGAKPSRIVGGLVRRGMILALLGLGAGLGGALAAGQLLRNLLFGVASADAPTFATVAVSILAVTLVANYLPASRATSIEPTAALREE